MVKGGLIGCVCLISLFAEALLGQGKIDFSFDKEGTFKIAQFTDLHLGDKERELSKMTFEVIQSILDKENPDLAIITGDVVTTPPVEDLWLELARVFEKNRTPWAVALGNHDGRDAGTTREGIYELIGGLPYFVGEKGDSLIAGIGNYAIAVKSNDNNKTASVIYILDSHNRPPNKKYGHWDWIKSNQIDWYKKERDFFTRQNIGQPLPSIAFFHIPLPEFNEIVGEVNTVGTKGENVSSPNINSGLFSAFIEGKDIMGVFTGHDHDNDYIGIHYGIALSFGRETGMEAYGDLERGARIIKLYQGEFKFDSWIRTPQRSELDYYYPSGISSVDEHALKPLPAKRINGKLKKGIHYSYYEGGRFKKVEDIKVHGKKLEEGIMSNFSIKSAKVEDSLAYVYRGFIKIPETGVYRFYTYSDDGSILLIDNQLVVDNDGSHNALRKEGKIGLEAGYHEITVKYFQDYMGKTLEVGWSGKNRYEEPIPDEVLFIED